MHYPSVGTPYARESLSVGNAPRSPCAPVGASEPALNGRGCASPLLEAGLNPGGSVASPVRLVGSSTNCAFAFSQASVLKPPPTGSRGAGASVMTALGGEFVAKPQAAPRAPAT